MDKKWFHYKTTPDEVKKLQDVLDRNSYRRFKQLCREDMAVVLARIYHAGMEEAKKQALDRAKARMEKRKLDSGDVAATLDADDILNDIMQIRGVGEKIGGAIAELFEGYAQ